jgi:DNA-binding GntR family transcriptional regulator
MNPEKIAEIIRERIMRGTYPPGRRIPSQSEMADEFGVSARTVGLAIAGLRERGYVWTLPHKGSYARPSEDWIDPGRTGGPTSTDEGRGHGRPSAEDRA